MTKPTATGRSRKGAAPKARKPRAHSWTKARRETFFSALAETANVRAAASQAGMSYQSAYKLRKRDGGFDASWQSALAEGYERLELMLLERAMHGAEQDVWYQGKNVGKMRNYSDSLALSLLRAHRDTVKRAPPEQDEAALRAMLSARFSEMNRRMGGDG